MYLFGPPAVHRVRELIHTAKLSDVIPWLRKRDPNQ
jgi:hypothetical protein